MASSGQELTLVVELLRHVHSTRVIAPLGHYYGPVRSAYHSGLHPPSSTLLPRHGATFELLEGIDATHSLQRLVHLRYGFHPTAIDSVAGHEPRWWHCGGDVLLSNGIIRTHFVKVTLAVLVLRTLEGISTYGLRLYQPSVI